MQVGATLTVSLVNAGNCVSTHYSLPVSADDTSELAVSSAVIVKKYFFVGVYTLSLTIDY